MAEQDIIYKGPFKIAGPSIKQPKQQQKIQVNVVTGKVYKYVPERCCVDELKDSEEEEDLTTPEKERFFGLISVANWPIVRPHKSKRAE